jgi:Sigma-70, region 4
MALSPLDREAVVLTAWFDLSSADAAQALGVTPAAFRMRVPRVVAVPVAAGVTLTAAAVLTLGGGPGELGGPSSAFAITQTLRWLNPPPGTILHVRSVEATGTQTTTREFWQSADHPGSARLRTDGAHAFEASGDALYGPATNTIYDPPAAAPAGDRKPETLPIGSPGDGSLPPGDPIVDKVRILLREGRMVVSGRELHDGTEAWAISLKPDVGQPVLTLWVSAADGKPLELRDPGRDASEQPQVIRWPTYEVLPGSDADALLTLAGAHPSARVVHDAAQTEAAQQRLMPPKP